MLDNWLTISCLEPLMIRRASEGGMHDSDTLFQAKSSAQLVKG